MAQDAVDFALGPEMTQQRPSVTANLPLLGAAGYQAVANQAAAIGARYGWTPAQVDHLLGRYGTLIGDITDLVDRDESLGQPVEHAGHYLKAEIVYAATHEDVIHLEDVMVRRTRLNHEAPGGGLAASRGIADLLAPHLGWDEAQVQQEVVAYARQVEADQAAAQVATDAAAEAIRQPARGLTPMLRGAEPVPAA
jgi:glycerol-3-phosphate dehydrogenase